MKKTYSKPQIIFESFSLSTNIAGDCEMKTDTQAVRTCGVEFGPVAVFLSDIAGCTRKVGVDDGFYNGICYDIPVDERNLFNS